MRKLRGFEPHLQQSFCARAVSSTIGAAEGDVHAASSPAQGDGTLGPKKRGQQNCAKGAEFWQKEKVTPTWTRTRVIGFRVRGDNRYTIGARKRKPRWRMITIIGKRISTIRRLCILDGTLLSGAPSGDIHNLEIQQRRLALSLRKADVNLREI
ncbi:hypothetical protein LSCM4_05459 [Leishmania orientalis]|uniref:Uncharacterized protein n=1 Tax=Leishmania orientalis TaxID=2249476 RepID=A0A836HJP1_9TRYP|nr:hypothetical protein LSCM4_05459 [Leishmania orientalis]